MSVPKVSLLVTLSAAPICAQSTPGADLFRHTITVRADFNCLAGLGYDTPPPIQTLTIPGGQPFPELTLPDCVYMFSPLRRAIQSIRVNRLAIDLPARTPLGTMSPLANGLFRYRPASPVQARVTFLADWSVSGNDPPPRAALQFSMGPVDSTAPPQPSCASNSTLLGSDRAAISQDCAWTDLTVRPDGPITFLTTLRLGLYSISVLSEYHFGFAGIDHVEVVQSVQTPDQQVPLVAGKSSVIRVFPFASNLGQVDIRARLRRDGDVVWTGARTMIPPSLARRTEAPGAAFLLPIPATVPGDAIVEVELAVDGSVLAQQSLPLSFLPSPASAVATARFCEGRLICAEQRDALSLAATMLPFPAAFAPAEYPFPFTYSDSSQMVRKLARLRVLAGLDTSQSPPERIVGILPRDGRFGAVAGSDRSQGTLWAGDSDTLLACALALDSGLQRVPSGATIGAPGYDLRQRLIIPPSTPDFMRCDGSSGWIAATAIRALLEFSAAPRTRMTGDPADYLIVSGTVARDGSAARLLNGFIQPSATLPPPSDPQGPWCLRTGASADHCFSIAPNALSGAEDGFAVAIPFPAGTPGVTLTYAGRELASLRPSRNAPEVRFLPTDPASPYTLRWSASDADGGTLSFELSSSADAGFTWTPVDFEIDATEYQLDSSAAGRMFQVRASDGVNTASATTELTVADQAPRVSAPQFLDLGTATTDAGIDRTLTITNSGSGPLRITAIE